MILLFSAKKHNLSYFEVVQSNLSAHKSFNSTSISIAPSFIAFRRGELAQRKAYINGIKILFISLKLYNFNANFICFLVVCLLDEP